jgi:class 3 adenylate cyclase
MRVGLGFADPETESAFRQHDDAASRGRRIAMCVVGGGFWALFGLLDPEIASHASRFIPARVIVSAILLVSGLVLWCANVPRAHEAIACFAPLSVAWAADIGSLIVHVPAYYVSGGNFMAALALFMLAGVRFRAAVTTGVLLFAGYVVSAVVTAKSPANAVAMIAEMGGGVCFGVLGSWLLEDLRRREYRLLHAILPDAIATRLRHEHAAIAEASDDVTVLFADVAGFTPMAATLTATQLVRLLDELFCEFDAICKRHRVEKIKTIGDAYMAAAGVPRPDSDHAGSIAATAVEMLAAAERSKGWPQPLELRIGISSGHAVAGVIGRAKFAYDLWGDTVNTASRMESHGEPGRIVVSETTRRLLGDRYPFGPPREVDVKGKGVMRTYVLAPELTSAAALQPPAAA